ncbi:KaiB domain-containing protein [Synechococcus sp. PCC 6312]|nr:KaiB domain-containing protein [Synechococcus sp. PCC 6312]
MGGGHQQTQSWLFKGVALFTPAFDLVYGLAVSKQGRWHHHLCSVLQGLLDLPEPPLFLCPAYTATVDFWVDLPTQQLSVVAEAHPLVWSQRFLLDVLFEHPAMIQLPWQRLASSSLSHDLRSIESYRPRFPQLWQHHNLVHGLESPSITVSSPPILFENPVSYTLRLYVSGHSIATAQTLKTLHGLLPQCLAAPYTLKIVDVTRQPELAESDQVTATPTLVRVSPPPLRRLVGKLDDLATLQWLLEDPPLLY